MARVIEILSPLAPEECAARLAEAIDKGVSERFVPGSKPVIGRVAGRSVRLRKRIRFHNGFQTILTGTLEKRPKGCRFLGRAGLDRITRILLVIWFSTWIFLSIWHAGVFLVRGGNPGAMLFAPIFLSLGAGLVCFGRWLARDEERFLINFLEVVTDGWQEISAEPFPEPPD